MDPDEIFIKDQGQKHRKQQHDRIIWNISNNSEFKSERRKVNTEKIKINHH